MANPRKPTPAPWRSRIIGEGDEAPDQLLANPLNFRVHPQEQGNALGGALDVLGWVQRVVVNRSTGNVIDGHLRVSLALQRGEPTIPVSYVELTEAEEALALATLDPIAAMAGTDAALLREVLATADPKDSAALAEFLTTLEPEPGGGSGGGSDDGTTPTKSRRGDLAMLGPHRVLCGNPSDPHALARLFADQPDRFLDGLAFVLDLLETTEAQVLGSDPETGACHVMVPSPEAMDALLSRWEAQDGARPAVEHAPR